MGDSASIYDGYWNHPDRIGKSSFSDPGKIANQVLSTCGLGRILDVGSGMGVLVRELLKRGADAYGMDVSRTAVAYCNRYAPGRFSEGSILSLPFKDGEFDTIVSMGCMEHLAPGDVPLALAQIHRVAGRYVFLQIATTQDRDNHWHLTVEGRAWWEQRCFEAGFRKHPAYYKVNHYESLNQDDLQIIVPLEKIQHSVLDKYPLTGLLEERDLHMDMSRESGARSDAHMARYALAAEWIRPGDTVLDCACGYGYGTAVLAASSRGKRYIGVDVEESVTQYATVNFTPAYNIEYKRGNAEDLSFIPDASIDVLVTFETLEHVLDYQAFLKEARRVIKPDGRIITGVPNLWVDETGNDPNPYHHHVFDYPKLRAALEKNGFLVEARYNQSAPGGFKLADSPRLMTRQPLDSDGQELDTEWCLLVASADPLAHTDAAYSHPDFDQSMTDRSCHVVDFGHYYDNPWLYRSMVQMGERVNDSNELIRLVEKVIAFSRKDSADHGAALCVLGYSHLTNQEVTPSDLRKFLDAVNEYILFDSSDPHVHRWQISMAYLAGVLALRTGDHELALQYFLRTSSKNACLFSPLLATKSISAHFHSGLIYLGRNSIENAKNCFRSGVETARHALHYSDINAIGNPDNPLIFGFPELSEIGDMASQCANALHYFNLYKTAPGMFWSLVDIKRFGMVTWNIELQEELTRAHARLAAQQTEQDKLDAAILYFAGMKSDSWLFKLYLWPLRILHKRRKAML